MAQYRLDEAIEKGIFDFIIAATGFDNNKVIWDKQDVAAPRNAVKPALPYITLNISSGPSSLGGPELRYKELDTFTLPMRKAFTLTCNVFSNLGWLEIAQQIVDGLEVPSIREKLRLADISQNGVHGDILDISELLDTKHEGRAAVDLFLAYTKSIDDVAGEIQKVEHTNDITGTTIQTETP
jgi:hypothetical protein